ncbi:MAG: hypothetical protein E7418_03510 [Ruminococcaceae bacterium]|nr:hypothetical protein [Oscillospiraceae bacterium]
MLEIILLIGFLALTIWAFCTNLIWGLIVLVVLGIYFYVKRYSRLCISLALQNYAKGDINGCFRWYERAYNHGMDVQQKITYAYYLMREGRVERSENLLNAVLAFPLKPELKYKAKSNHAVLLLKTGRRLEATEELEEIFPYFKNTNTYGSLGYLYILNGNLIKAKEFNFEAYEYNKDDVVILDNMVQLHIALRDYESAYQYVTELMAKESRFIEAYYNAALVEKELGKFEDAKVHLTHALTIRTTFMSSVSHEEAQALLDSLPTF